MTRAAFAVPAVVAAAGLLARSAVPVAYACLPPIDPPAIAEEVAASDYIFTGAILRQFVDPPLDPAVPDELWHALKVEITVGETIKGEGPGTVNYTTTTSYYFAADGSVQVSVIDCGLLPVPEGAPVLVLANQSESGVAVRNVLDLSSPYGQQYLADVLAVLNPTPTPVATASPQPTVAPAATPAGLPDSGGAPPGQDPGSSDQVPSAESERQVNIRGVVLAAIVFISLVALAVFVRFRKRP